MGGYERQLKSRIWVGRIFALIVIAIGVYDTFFAGVEVIDDHIVSFQKGLLVGIAFISIAIVIKAQATLKDHQELRLEYNRERDERSRLIQSKAGLSMIIYTSAAMILTASLIARSFPMAFIALVAAGVGQMLVAGVTKIILSRRI